MLALGWARTHVVPAHRSGPTTSLARALAPTHTEQSGVVYGGSALLNAVNGITPHLAGAVDVFVVEQPDGTFKSSPFYGQSPCRKELCASAASAWLSELSHGQNWAS